MNPTANPPAPVFHVPGGPELERFLNGPLSSEAVLRIDSGGIADGDGYSQIPGSILIKLHDGGPLPGRTGWPLSGRARILAIGSPLDVADHPAAASALQLALPDCVLIPGLVNAHTHLDLTHVGPRPFDAGAGFDGWVDMVRTNRAATDESIAAAVRAGIELSLASGTVAVGDIAGANATGPNLTPWRTLAASPLYGVSFLEFFAIGKRESAGLARMQSVVEAATRTGERAERVRFGLQPHAPNTVSVAAYRIAVQLAAQHGLLLSTHLAESPQEHELIERGTGSLRALLERLNIWDDELSTHFGRGRTPTGHLQDVLAGSAFLLAHVNDASDEDLEILARTGQTVVYCPRASEYFGNERFFGPHRYRAMRARGVRVVLGTDSIINLPPDRCGLDSGGIGVLDEMRRLHDRDGVDPVELLAMGTVEGARALGLDPDAFRFGVGKETLGIVAVPAPPGLGLRGVMESNSVPRLLLIRK